LGSFELRAAAGNADGGKNAGDCRRGHRQSKGKRRFPARSAWRNAFLGIVIDECNFPGKIFPWRQ
jgi:hypothetical protein